MMTNGDNERGERISAVIAMLFICFGVQDPDRQTLYSTLLARVPPEYMEIACKKMMLTHRFLPFPADILDAARELRDRASGRVVKPWSEAKKEIVSAITTTLIHGVHDDTPETSESYGTVIEPKFSSPAAEMAYKAFKDEYARATDHEAVYILKQMEAVYESELRRERDAMIDRLLFREAGVQGLPEGKGVTK